MKRIVVSSVQNNATAVTAGEGVSRNKARRVEKALRSALNEIETCNYETYTYYCFSEIHEQLMDAIQEISMELNPVE